MIPVTQTKVSVKNSLGNNVVNGNCFAACVASIIELPITEVPNVEVLFDLPDSLWFEVMGKFLESKGFELYTSNTPPEQGYYIANGVSPRGILHSCVYHNGELVWDPHPSHEGITSEKYYFLIDKINQ